MLTEFAFTPSIFDEDAHADRELWRDQLRALNAAMFPHTSVWPIVVADLFSGSWSSHVMPYVDRISDHRAKRCCQDLLVNIRRMLVVRPACREWPFEDDIAWCREALAACEAEPIDRILSVQATKLTSAQEFKAVRTIDEVEDAGFWNGIRSDASPRMVIADQVELLRKMSLHSQWIAIVNPYGFGNEQDFTLRVTEQALRRDVRFGPLHIELHSQAPDVTDPEEQAIRQNNVTTNMCRKIGPHVSDPNRVDLYYWPTLLDRLIVAGAYVKESNGNTRKSPRWGVSMSHVARGSDPDAAPTEWKLLTRDSLDAWFRRLIAEDVASKPLSVRIPSATPA